MVVPEISSGVLIGIAIGIFGVSFWVIGLVVFNFLVDRYQDDPQGLDEP